jgi:hypothetical protein
MNSPRGKTTGNCELKIVIIVPHAATSTSSRLGTQASS